jgi:hypothetical protein
MNCDHVFSFIRVFASTHAYTISWETNIIASRYENVFHIELIVRSCVLLPLMYLSIQGGVDDQLDRTEDAHLQHRPHDRGHGDGHALESQRALYSKDQRGGKFSSNSQQR